MCRMHFLLSVPVIYIAIFVLSSVQNFCCPSIHHLLEKYEVLNYETTRIAEHHRRKRSTAPESRPTDHLELQILAFGKNLTVVLHRDYEIVHADARLIVSGSKRSQSLSSYSDHMVRGIAANYPDSTVFGSIVNGVFRGTIVLNRFQTHPDMHVLEDSYFVEPAGYYFEDIVEFHSIIYHSSHVRKQQHHKESSPDLSSSLSHFCGLSNPEIVQKMQDLTLPLPEERQNLRRTKRNAGIYSGDNVRLSESLRQPQNIAAKSDPRLQGVSNKSCNLLLQSDTPLWNRVIKLAHINGNVDAAVTEISTILHQHVQAAQTVFNSHVFRDHSGKLEFSGIGFLVYQVVINVTDVDCKRRSEASASGQDSDAQSNRQNDGSYADQNPFCSESIDVTNTLNLFSYNKFDGYCAAYLFTYRDFVGGTLGLAWVGSACSRYRLVSEGTQDVRKSLNTGLVTLVNYGNPVPSQVSQVTFIHELGHNFGAQHDNNHQDQPYGCLPSTHDPRGNYIMFASATSGTKENNRRFSKCSLDSIARFLHGLSTNGRNCFVQSGGPFCGNSLVEADEECDCGVSSRTCRDKCCNPRNSASPCKLVDQIMVNGIAQKARCSITAGECCTSDCQFHTQSHMCREATECYDSSFCNGRTAQCPSPVLRPDGTVCQEGTRVCKQGQCVGSICESIPNWIECTVARDESVTSESLCYVACQENKTGAVCVSSEMLLKDSSLQTQYPKLTKVLLKNNSPMRMSAGTPCDSYQGYCDRFHRCISVDVKGPLARLQNLLFSPRMLDKAKSWVTFHWWAMILMCLGAVIAMIVFVKLCARHTPMARSRYPHRGRAISTAPAVWVAEHWPDGAEEPEGPPPPYSPHPEEYHRRRRDQADIVNPSHSRWAWPKNRAPESRQPKRSKGLHSANGAPTAARRARCRTAEDMTPYPNARRKPLPPSHPKSTMRNSGVPEETAMKLTPIVLHESTDNNGNRLSNNNALPGPSENLSPQAATQAKFSQVPRTGATKSRHMARTSGVRRPVSVPRPTSMFVRSPNPASIARPDPPRQPRGPRRSRPTIRPVSTIFHSDDVDIGSHVHHSPPALLEEWSLIPTSACIPVRSSARATEPIRQFSAEPGTSELMHAGPSASTEMSSLDSGLPPPAYADLPFQKPVLHRRRSSPSRLD